MIVKQVTVRVENREGKLQEVMDILGQENINVEAISMADTVTRLIVPDPESVAQILKQHKYQVELTDVIRVKIPSRPGALAQMLVSLAEAKINLEYMYAFGSAEGDQMIFYPSDVQKTAELLADLDA